MQPDVTVIVAAYNAMPYVVECIESLFAQTLPQDRIEILVVDDGSTDGTGEELDRLAVDAPSMRVIHQPNSGGPSVPRNRALDIATGRYVFVLDADDYLGPEALERMVRVADENGTDVVLAKMVSVGGRNVPQLVYEETVLSTPALGSRAFRTLGAWKLYRREMLERHAIRFPEDLNMGEDQPFVLRAYFAARAISILGDYDYLYFRHRDDGQNLTLVATASDVHVPSLARAFDVLEECVEPGSDRDAVAARLLHAQAMRNVLVRLPAETDAAVTHRVLEEVRDWLKRFYNDEVAEQLPWRFRVCYEAVAANDADAIAVLGALEAGAEFKLRHELTELRWSGTELVARGRLGLAGLPVEQVAEIDLVARGRGVSILVPVVLGELDAEAGTPFEVHLDVARVADGERLAEGRWDAFAQVRYRGARRRVRFGIERAQTLGDGPGGCEVPLRLGGRVRVVAYFASGEGNLALHVRPPVSGPGRAARWLKRRLAGSRG
ncbi:MAG: glycosyltransferase family 2 protein [Coriobacteriia bacterium]|nr:glycosyltransferase family 2 protein [Coriobacteriia bacterium]